MQNDDGVENRNYIHSEKRENLKILKILKILINELEDRSSTFIFILFMLHEELCLKVVIVEAGVVDHNVPIITL